MTNKKRNIFITVLIAATISIIIAISIKRTDKTNAIARVVTPQYGEIKSAVSATGTVLPYNRLEIKPQVNGRVESVLVAEGQKVHKGHILCWMSSTERAALIDAARAQGAASLKYWEDAYKAIPVVAPINGTVISRAIEPGQTILTTTAILVLSDRLIVKANVDETDIGKVKKGQRVNITLDAYPEITVNGRVDLIGYESTTSNNVTTYVVNIVCDMVPEVFRSGMTANVDIITQKKLNALLVPSDAVINENQKTYVWIIGKKEANLAKKKIQTGLSDDRNVEVVSGIDGNDRIAVMMQSGINLEVKKQSNPFVPTRKSKQ